MKKPVWKTIANPVEENEFFIVDKKKEGFVVYNKITDSIFDCVKYVIVGSTLIYKIANGDKYVTNEIQPQRYGQGNVLVNSIEIKTWGYKTTKESKQLYIKYFDEKGFLFVRLVDEHGNLYKKQAKQLQEVDVVSI